MCLKAYRMPTALYNGLSYSQTEFYNSGKVPPLQLFYLCHNNGEANSRNTLLMLQSKLPGMLACTYVINHCSTSMDDVPLSCSKICATFNFFTWRSSVGFLAPVLSHLLLFSTNSPSEPSLGLSGLFVRRRFDAFCPKHSGAQHRNTVTQRGNSVLKRLTLDDTHLIWWTAPGTELLS